MKNKVGITDPRFDELYEKRTIEVPKSNLAEYQQTLIPREEPEEKRSKSARSKAKTVDQGGEKSVKSKTGSKKKK